MNWCYIRVVRVGHDILAVGLGQLESMGEYVLVLVVGQLSQAFLIADVLEVPVIGIHMACGQVLHHTCEQR